MILSKEGYELGITGRREALLRNLQQKLTTKIIAKYMDICDVDTARETMQELLNEMGDVSLIILCSGTGNINNTLDWKTEMSTIHTNVLGISALLTLSYSYFEKEGQGHLCAISSIAALKGNAQAPSYHASKAFLSNYLESLYYKSGKNIMITDIRPGLIDTDMAKGDGLFWVMPVHKAAKQIYTGIQRKKRIIYVTKRWKVIAILLKLIPQKVYKLLN
jgi:short-subunit dehydrogenase